MAKKEFEKSQFVRRTIQGDTFIRESCIFALLKNQFKVLVFMGKGDIRSKKGKRVRKSWGVTRPRTDKGIGAFVPLSVRTAAAASTEPKAPKAAKAKKATKTAKTAAPKVAAKAAVPKVAAKAVETKVAAKAAEPKAAPAKAKKTAKKAGGDDLTKIEGVGPKLSQVLAEAGVDSYATLSTSKVDKLKEILESAGSRYKMFDPTTWPEQATLAAAGKWDELDTLKGQLDGGRKK